jgi:hypothetical protein
MILQKKWKLTLIVIIKYKHNKLWNVLTTALKKTRKISLKMFIRATKVHTIYRSDQNWVSLVYNYPEINLKQISKIENNDSF